MEPEPSQAAIAAIAALQDRIKILEDEHSVLTQEYEVLARKKNLFDQKFQARVQAIQDATEKAQTILTTTHKTLTQLQEARNENKRLNHQIEEIEKVLALQIKKNKKLSSQNKMDSATYQMIKQRLEEYEILIGEILAPPPQSNAIFTDNTLAGDADSALLPEPLNELLKTLQMLPKNFRRQNIETKRAIILSLSAAKSTTSDLNAKIKVLEKEKFLSSTPNRYNNEIKKQNARIIILSNEMNKFNFQ